MHRFRTPELFLGCFLAVAVFASGMLFASRQNSGYLAQADSAEKTSQPTSNKGEPKSFLEPLTTDPVAAFTLGLFVVGLAQAGLFFVQLRLIRESLGPAKEAADAARLNAQALIDAESAQMYVIVLESNFPEIFANGIRYDSSPTMHESPSAPPWIKYKLRNYGKSPAILQSIVHGFAVEGPEPGKSREYAVGRDSMEIVGDKENSSPVHCAFDRPFIFGDVRSIVEHDKLLYFYGRADFLDHFGRKQILEWEFVADAGIWHLVAHSNTRKTDT